METKVRILGLDRLYKMFDKMADPALVKEATRDTGKIVLERLRQYPPQRARLNAVTGNAPRHQRTGDLGRGWKQELSATAKGFSVYVRNTVAYVSYVQIEGMQAWFHQQIWGTDADAAKEAAEKSGYIFNDEIQRKLES